MANLANCHTGYKVVLDKEEFLIGRGLKCDLVIKDLFVSRVHCILRKGDNNTWQLEDRSASGTQVNHNTIPQKEKVTIKEGDVITLGVRGPNEIPAHPTLSYTFIQSDHNNCSNGSNVSGELSAGDEIPSTEPCGSGSETPNEDHLVRDPAVAMAELSRDIEEFSCPICSELFIDAVTLNCSHSFCKYCIDEWRRSKSDCPFCRTPIRSINSSLVLDNYIRKYFSRQCEAQQKERRDVVEERQVVINAQDPIATVGQPIEVNSSDDDGSGDFDDEDPFDEDFYDEDEDESYEEEEEVEEEDDGEGDGDGDDDGMHGGISDEGSEDEWDENMDLQQDFMPEIDEYQPNYNGVAGKYFGGYGHCFKCGDPNHWANGCPNK